MDGENAAELGGNILNAYAGPYHLASLLLAAYDGISEAAFDRRRRHQMAPIRNSGGNGSAIRAGQFPFLWPNHREAIAKEFHQTAKSAVVVLPTGAGKTTVSSLKIAGVLRAE